MARMTFWDVTRNPTSVRLLLEFGRRRGLAASRMLGGSRLTLAQLDEAERSIAPAQELAVVENLLGALPDEDPVSMGWQVGLGYHASAYGVLGLGWLSCGTGMQALAMARRFLPLTFAFAAIDLRTVGPRVELDFEAPATLEATVQRFVVARAMGATVCVLRDILGSEAGVRRILLRGRQPADGGWAQALGAEVSESAKHDRLILDAAVLRRPLPQANATTQAMCERMCETLVGRRRLRLDTATLVRELLASFPDELQPRLADAAQGLHVSERTLKRWLQAEQTSFGGILLGVRRAKADRLLGNPSLSLTDIAQQLGYHDLSAFSQAYKRWCGVSPGASVARRRPQGAVHAAEARLPVLARG